jgi:hypothetical protein
VNIFRRLRKRPGDRPDPRQDAPSESPSPPSGRPTYEETRVESAILGFLANEKPTGAAIPELALALGFDRETIQDAVDQLVRLEVVRERDGLVILGPPGMSDDQTRQN